MTNVDFLLELYCLVDETLGHVMPPGGLRQRGFAPRLADAEVLTMELAGECWKLHEDAAIFQHFRTYHLREFPALAKVCRTTFARQAANLYKVAQQLVVYLGRHLPGECRCLWHLDSLPIPVCRFARARHARLFKGQASFGYDHLNRQIFYGFKLHACCAHNGPVAMLELAPAHVADLAMVEELIPACGHTALADRNYWDPDLKARLAQRGFHLETPFKMRKSDPDPQRSRAISHLRQRIETVFGQLVERFGAKVVQARDLWHLCHRTTRKVLAHCVAVLINVRHGHPPLQLQCILGS